MRGEENNLGKDRVELSVNSFVLIQKLVSNYSKKFGRLECILQEGCVVALFVFEQQVDHEFDHENLHDLIGYSVPVRYFLIRLAVLLLEIFGEFLEPEVDIEGLLDVYSVDIDHHVLKHQCLFVQVLELNLSLQKLHFLLLA